VQGVSGGECGEVLLDEDQQYAHRSSGGRQHGICPNSLLSSRRGTTPWLLAHWAAGRGVLFAPCAPDHGCSVDDCCAVLLLLLAEIRALGCPFRCSVFLAPERALRNFEDSYRIFTGFFKVGEWNFKNTACVSDVYNLDVNVPTCQKSM
jgi:hypothetical protein